MEYALKALYFALVLLASARVLKRVTLMSKKPYDFAVNVTFGTLAGSAILQPAPIWHGTAAIAMLTAFAWGTNALTSRWPARNRLLAGRPVPLVEGGRAVTRNLASMRMSSSELRGHLRTLTIRNLADVELAVLEPSGRIGIVRAQPSSSSPEPRQLECSSG